MTAETAPHYVSLTDRELLRGDADYRMNPPLRTQADVDEIINGLCDGTLDAIATDHAPHTPDEKADFVKAPTVQSAWKPRLRSATHTLLRQAE